MKKERAINEKGKIWLKREMSSYRPFILFLCGLSVCSTLFSLSFAYFIRYLINSASDGNAKRRARHAPKRPSVATASSRAARNATTKTRKTATAVQAHVRLKPATHAQARQAPVPKAHAATASSKKAKNATTAISRPATDAAPNAHPRCSLTAQTASASPHAATA